MKHGEENKDFSGNNIKFDHCKANKRRGHEAIGEQELAYTCRYNPTTLKPPEASPKRVMWRHQNGRIREARGKTVHI